MDPNRQHSADGTGRSGRGGGEGGLLESADGFRAGNCRDRRAVPAAARGVRPARPLRSRQADRARRRGRRVPAGAADQRHRGDRARRGLLRRAARPQGPHAGRHEGPRLGADELWLDTEPEALAATRRHLETYKIGREVEVEDVGEARAILSLIGPATGAVATTAALGRDENEADDRLRRQVHRGRHRRRDRPDRRHRRGRRAAPGPARSRRRRGRARGGGDPADRGGRPRSASR